jgi:NAD(P)-dependent dehydrogenase (short-subunit alcohol dehydrogenase family)
MDALRDLVNPSLTGKVAIVTGAGQGIGRVFAKAFALAGATPVIAEKNSQSAKTVVEEMHAEGLGALAVEADVADPVSVRRLADTVLQKFGRIDILVNNAAIFSTLEMRPFEEIPLSEWETVLRVNVTGPFLCACAVLPAMRKAGKGRIVNIASGAVTLGRPNYLHYIASKGALIGMSRSMARELGPARITVNSILPGATFTEVERKTVSPTQKEQIVAMQCIPRPQIPDDLVGALLFLSSDASAFMTGQSLTVDGGATHS